MRIGVLGISYKTAPLHLREHFAFPKDELGQLAQELKAHAPAGTVLLSTCNRTELYFSTETMSFDWAENWLFRKWGTPCLREHLYHLEDSAAIHHLFRVAAGLDSMVIGENEILKQVKDAYHLAHAQNLTDKILNVLFQRALFVGKNVRTHTTISQGALSVGSVAVNLAEKIFGDLSQSSVLIFGAGKMAEVSARYLLGKNVRRLWVSNRTLSHAQELAQKFQAEPLTLEQGLNAMSRADVVITSLSVEKPLLTREQIARTLSERNQRPLFLIDIAVPRNIEPEAHTLDNAYLYNIDDLQTLVKDNLASRSSEVEKAAEISTRMAHSFCEWLASVQQGREKSLRHSPEGLANFGAS